MKTDAELLTDFVDRHAENAFTELVNRHVSVVYSAACRETGGDFSAAEDVTQLVFIELVRKAASLTRHPTLAGWLYTSVRYTCANLRRTDHRRNIREGEACAMNELMRSDPNDPTWQEIRPVLDDAMHELDQRDRDAVLLRFFEGKNLREVGEGLCLSENAARMRVDRALEKLRNLLAKRGVRSTSSALASALAVGVIAAPPALKAAVTGSVLATATVSAASSSSLFGIATLTKLKMIGFSALVIAAVSVPIWQQQRYERLARENESLRDQLGHVPLTADEAAQTEPLRFRTEAVAAPKSGAELQTGTAAEKPEETWRQRFEAAYKLRGGEILRCISAPFIPERTEYCRREFRNQRSTPDYLVLRQDGKGLHAQGAGFDYGKSYLAVRADGKGLYSLGSGVDQGRTKLEDVLRYVLRLKRYEFYGADELLAAVVPGDWVIRAGASMESQLAALEPILRAKTGHNVRFEKSPVEYDVIIVRGSFAPAKAGQKLDIFAENKDKEWGKSSRGSFQDFLGTLGDCLNVPFANEVQLQNQLPITWFRHVDADYSHAGARRLELLNKVLANLQQQTSLSFGLERRPGQIWLVKEQP